jgi:hypothetical protein
VSTSPTTGWYDDPQDSSQLRWWDGSHWGSATQAKPLAAPPPQGAPYQSSPPAAQTTPPTSFGQVLSELGHGVEGATNDPSGFYHGHQKAIDTAGGAALLADGAGVLPGSRHGNPLGALVAIFAGVIFVVAGLFFLTTTKVPSGDTGHAVGTVTQLNLTTSSGSNGSIDTYCQPTARYTVDGTSYTANATTSQSPCGYTVGSQVTVDYDPHAPASAVVAPSTTTKYAPWLFIGIGALVLVLGIFQLITKLAELGAGGFLLYKGIKRDQARPRHP